MSIATKREEKNLTTKDRLLAKHRFLQTMEKCAAALAKRNHFRSLTAHRFLRECDDRTEWFVAILSIEHDVGFLEPVVSISVPELEKLIEAPLVEGTNKYTPSFGGPLYRFADLQSTNLSNYVVEFSDNFSLTDSVEKLEHLWRGHAEPFFERYSNSNVWVAEVTGFLEQNRVGALGLTSVGCTCVAMTYAAEGSDAAHRALETLTIRGAAGRAIHDFAKAEKLLRKLDDEPMLIGPLRAVIERNQRPS